MPIKELGKRKYFIRVSTYINGKKREKKFTGILPTKGDARNKEKQLKVELSKLKEYEENEALRYTWRKALNEYFEYSEENHRLSTYYNRKKALEAYTKEWKTLDTEEIDKSMVKDKVSKLDTSISHKKDLLKYIRQVFENSIDNRKVNFNPAKRIKIHGDKDSRDKANHLMAMTKDEVYLVLNYIRESNPDWYSIFYVTYQLGLRSSEAIALEYSDIKWEKDHIVISKSWSKYKGGTVPPKNGTSRIVPMNTQLKEFLLLLKKENQSDTFVLPRIKSWMNGGATKVLQSIQKELGIKLTNYHSLRASFITHLLRNGMDIVRVQAMVGHSELRTTQRYIRLDATDLKGATELLQA
ncbi:tyrosine-type recombinase/integrase [Halobacteriovorax sp. GFR7]|uniref:tyrosine-type recombinase/integrase n=1 Tax=unclassified Halobacteriovorax TaxID=2639665 RepID=UPI003D9800D9